MNGVFEHILVLQQHAVTDCLALTRAIRLAEQYHSRLTVFKSLHSFLHQRNAINHDISDDLALWIKQQQDSILQQVSNLTELSAQNLSLKIVISWQEAEKTALTKLLKRTDTSLIIKQQQKRSGLQQFFYHNLDHYLINDCELPVWLVKANNIASELQTLACLDIETEHSSNHYLNDTILDLGSSLTHADPKKLHVVNCYCNDDYDIGLPYEATTGFSPAANIAQHQQLVLERYLTEHHLPKQCLQLCEGLPDTQIPKAADEQHAQLAIIGNNHMHNFSSVLLGDTAHYLAEHTPCDVLIVKPQQLSASI